VVGQLQREFVPHPQVIENFDIYPLHVSRDVGRQVLGCDIAVYLEVGYLDGELSISASTPSKCLPPLTLMWTSFHHLTTIHHRHVLPARAFFCDFRNQIVANQP
jgi:hypothetical protein